MKQKTLLAFAVSTLIFGFAAGLVVSGRLSMTSPSLAATGPDVAQAPTGRTAIPALATSPLPDLSVVAEAALKVAANISSTRMVRTSPDPFWQMFGGYGTTSQPSRSLGSGVVVSSDGYILTNTHVIGTGGENADVKVTLNDGRELPGKIIGIDDVSDLAVLKVDATGLDTLPWGDSSKLRVAQWVLAIGNPFQLNGTVTLGIVSTVNRSAAQVGSEYSNFIQTDAAINPGNSGGALVNARGELVGINSMIYSETGGYQGIGFAIPSNTAMAIMKELKTNHVVKWGSLGAGVSWYDLDRFTAQRNGLGDVTGVLVNRIYQDASLYLAGVRPGDVVVAFRDQPVTTQDELNRLVVLAPIGGKVKLDVIRGGQRVSLNVPIVSRQ